MARRKERKEEEFLTAKYAKSAKWDGAPNILLSGLLRVLRGSLSWFFS
jgi:hypothetical protein